MLRVISALRHGVAIAVLVVLGLNPLVALGADSPAKRSPVQFTVVRPDALAGVVSSAPADLAADRIEFEVLEKRDLVKYQVRIVGYVKNVRGGRFAGKATARLQESINGKWSVVAQSSVPALAPGQELRLVYDRLWNTQWSFYPDYRLEVLLEPDYRGDDSRNNVKSRSGADMAARIPKENPKANVADPNRSIRGDLQRVTGLFEKGGRTVPAPGPAAPSKPAASNKGSRVTGQSAKGTSSSAKAAALSPVANRRLPPSSRAADSLPSAVAPPPGKAATVQGLPLAKAPPMPQVKPTDPRRLLLEDPANIRSLQPDPAKSANPNANPGPDKIPPGKLAKPVIGFKAITVFPCKNAVQILLDRSGDYWKGDVRMELLHQGTVLDVAFINATGIGNSLQLHNSPSVTQWWFTSKEKDKYPAEKVPASPRFPNGAAFNIRFYLGAGGKWTKAPHNEDKTVQLKTQDTPSISNVSPTYLTPGPTVPLVIEGKNLVGPEMPTTVAISVFGNSQWPEAKLTPQQASPEKLTVLWQVPNYFLPGMMVQIWVRTCGGDCSYKLYTALTPPTPPTPTPPPQSTPPPSATVTKSYVLTCYKTAPAQNGGKIYYLGQMTPVPNGVIQSIENTNLGLGKQWTVFIPKPGVDTNNCTAPGKSYVIGPGQVSSDYKGVSLTGGQKLGFVLSTTDPGTWSLGLPPTWGLTITYTVPK